MPSYNRCHEATTRNGAPLTTVHRTRTDLAARPIGEAITTRGKELAVADAVAAARRLFANESVQVLPVLDGTAYIGAVDRDAIGDDVPAAAAITPFVSALLPTVIATTSTAEALAALDRDGSTRLVVLDADGATFVGLVCLRSDRERLCVDAVLHRPDHRSTERTRLMSPIRTDTHVAALVLEQPSRARVFERFGIDYCCGGKTPLETACADRGLDVVAVMAALDEPRADDADDVDWTAAPVADLCAHIVGRHHAYLRDELPPLRQLTGKVARVHGDHHPELVDVQTTFATLADELEQHMATEERVLFPACIALADGAVGGFPFGSVENPIRLMLHEHDEVAAGLTRLRALTNAYSPPSDGCNSYRALFDRLQTLETDTHRHIHEENNILFPRAVALESAR